ncbi:MAG: hypothetical protein LAP39_15265 [Acidobacteriia bacterium]|nr:hypothetical protein [Terriglobia bacterium]
MNFDRSAAADLWRNTLSQIPTTYGRLIYLASLRDQNTGTYHHHGLAQLFDEEQADQTMRQSHRQVFAEWLCFNLEQQKKDLEAYLEDLHEDKKTILATWIRLSPYRSYVPANAREVERNLFITDLETVLELLRYDYAVASPDPDA